jgi:hypothetical protein
MGRKDSMLRLLCFMFRADSYARTEVYTAVRSRWLKPVCGRWRPPPFTTRVAGDAVAEEMSMVPGYRAPPPAEARGSMSPTRSGSDSPRLWSPAPAASRREEKNPEPRRSGTNWRGRGGGRRCPPSPVESRRVPPSPAEFRRVPPSPAEFRRVPSNPAEFRRVPSNPAESCWVSPSPAEPLRTLSSDSRADAEPRRALPSPVELLQVLAAVTFLLMSALIFALGIHIFGLNT